MSKTFTSRTNGLELHIPADMGAAVRFFSVGEDARRVIDDGSTSTRTDDPDQLKAELARANARVAALEKQAAASDAKAAAKPVKAAKAADTAPAAGAKTTEPDLA